MLLLYLVFGARRDTKFHIYIPLCFYFIPTPHEGNPSGIRFTFHYASTLSRYKEAFLSSYFIYIPLCFYFITRSIRFIPWVPFIYIPLCFYFIPSSSIACCITSVFTFHYASTLSRFLLQKSYVPKIYIPLCFYFIPQGDFLYVRWSEFTFHYASTLS